MTRRSRSCTTPSPRRKPRELAAQIERVLARLPQSQRVAFELIKNEGLSVAEAAQVLGTTVAAVKLRAHRA
jgi:RNA polymerase sigma-70 factor (ECF subfamily)